MVIVVVVWRIQPQRQHMGWPAVSVWQKWWLQFALPVVSITQSLDVAASGR